MFLVGNDRSWEITLKKTIATATLENNNKTTQKAEIPLGVNVEQHIADVVPLGKGTGRELYVELVVAGAVGGAVKQGDFCILDNTDSESELG